MREKLIELTNRLIAMNSVSCNTNREVIDSCRSLLEENGFTSEIVKYTDPNSIEKFNLVARKGNGSGGLAFLMHSDTVPLESEDQVKPYIKDNKIFGRGACDMKGPIAAALLAGINSDKLGKPLTYIITSDEEIGCEGAEYLVKHSRLLKEFPPKWGIATEPTELKPVYAHKGLGSITITATGSAAHSSTDKGVSANFKIAPFMYFISTLKEKYNIDKSYQNSNFEPATNGLNMVITDFNCALNITAPKSRCKINFRTMPNSRSEDIIKEIKEEADRLGLTSTSLLFDSLYTDPEASFVKVAEKVAKRESGTVAYLTDAFQFKDILQPIILGPGSINQAHTKDEYIDIDQLEEGYDIYIQMINELC